MTTQAPGSEMPQAVEHNPNTAATRWNLDAIENAYERWRRDPASVDSSWQYFFEGFELSQQFKPSVPAGPVGDSRLQTGMVRLIYRYRDVGHFLAHLDPLSEPRTSHPLLDLAEFGFVEADLDRGFESIPFLGLHSGTLRELLEALRETYCRNVGVEYMHIQDANVRAWLQERMEPRRNQAWVRSQPEAPHPQGAALRRDVREVPRRTLPKPETLLSGRGRDPDPAAGSGGRECPRHRRQRDHHGHGSPRPTQRPGQHPPQTLRGDLRPVRGELPARIDRWRRRREISPRLLRRPHHQQGPADPPVADAQPQPPGSGQPRGRGPDPGQAAAVRRHRAQAGASRCCCTATPRLPARGWWPRRSTCRSCPATPPAAPSTSSSTTRSASPPPPATPARPPTAPTSPR